MANRLRLTPAAIADIEAITDYLHRRSPLAATRFVDAARATFDHVRDTPRAYPEIYTRIRVLHGIRWRALTGAFHRYSMFYRVVSDGVDVIRVLHSARDVEGILAQTD